MRSLNWRHTERPLLGARMPILKLFSLPCCFISFSVSFGNLRTTPILFLLLKAGGINTFPCILASSRTERWQKNQTICASFPSTNRQQYILISMIVHTMLAMLGTVNTCGKSLPYCRSQMLSFVFIVQSFLFTFTYSRCSFRRQGRTICYFCF